MDFKQWLLQAFYFTPTLEQGFKKLRINVVRQIPHDNSAFTQSLLFWDGRLYESTGLHQMSSLKKIEPLSGDIEKKVRVASRYFASGLSEHEEKILQLTFENKVLFYKKTNLRPCGSVNIHSEGWGICRDLDHYYISTGGDKLLKYRVSDFRLLGELPIILAGKPVSPIAELECVGDFIFANIWNTDFICKIEKSSGDVKAVINCGGVLPVNEKTGAELLSGIAFNPNDNLYYITGKFWPFILAVVFVDL